LVGHARLVDLFVPDIREAVAGLDSGRWARRAHAPGHSLETKGRRRSARSGSRLSPIHHRGEIAGFLAMATEMTEKAQAEERLRVEQDRGRALLEAMPDTVFELSPYEASLLLYRARPGIPPIPRARAAGFASSGGAALRIARIDCASFGRLPGQSGEVQTYEQSYDS